MITRIDRHLLFKQKISHWFLGAGIVTVILTYTILIGILSYWSVAAPLVIFVLACMGWKWSCSPFNERLKTVLMKVGYYSFSIYLLHMPFAGIITNLSNRLPVQGGLVFIRPIIVIMITYYGIQICCILAKKIGGEKVLRLVLGIRQ